MKKFLKSLPFRLILALIIGIALGRVFGYGVMKVVVTLQYVLGQLITHTFKFEDVQKGFELLKKPEKSYVKGLVTFD